jgi:hypothetical protein
MGCRIQYGCSSDLTFADSGLKQAQEAYRLAIHFANFLA